MNTIRISHSDARDAFETTRAAADRGEYTPPGYKAAGAAYFDADHLGKVCLDVELADPHAAMTAEIEREIADGIVLHGDEGARQRVLDRVEQWMDDNDITLASFEAAWAALAPRMSTGNKVDIVPRRNGLRAVTARDLVLLPAPTA